jgi:YbgC/YbaW family acyl-CoA thioester hydrolase
MKTFCHKHDVRMRETDLAGYAFYGNYLGYMDDARLAHFKEIGFDIQRMKRTAFAFTVAEVHVWYLEPVYFQQDIWVYTRFTKLSDKAIKAEHVITKAEVPDDKVDEPFESFPGVCHRGETTLVGISLAEKKVASIPLGFDVLF